MIRNILFSIRNFVFWRKSAETISPVQFKKIQVAEYRKEVVKRVIAETMLSLNGLCVSDNPDALRWVYLTKVQRDAVRFAEDYGFYAEVDFG